MNALKLSSFVAPLSVSLALAVLAGSALASPALQITAGPVIPNGAGPAFDPNANQGQWFLDNNGANTQVRTHEFYDNIDGSGGGPPNHLAIKGQFVGWTLDGFGNAVGYKIIASITNNTNVTNGAYAPGRNSHGEQLLAPSNKYVGTLYDTKLTIHWADDGTLGNFLPTGGAPNYPAPGSPMPTSESNAYGKNYDELGWYSYHAGNAVFPPGQFQVPTWDFGNILIGQTVNRLLDFGLYNPIPAAQIPAVNPNGDLLIARSDDLKIGAYFQADPVLFGIYDSLTPYPGAGLPGTQQFGYSNSSVFFNVPTPGVASVLSLAALVASRRKR